MKYIIFILCMAFSATASADIYVIYHKETRDIYTVSEKNDFVVPEGHEVKQLPYEQISDLGLTENPNNHKYNNGRFIVNNEKLNEIEQEKIKRQEILQEQELIEKEMKLQALKALKQKGKKFKHIKEADFQTGGGNVTPNN